jgi:hypothetical protein
MEITVVKLFYNTELQQNHEMAVNYRGREFYKIGPSRK